MFYFYAIFFWYESIPIAIKVLSSIAFSARVTNIYTHDSYTGDTERARAPLQYLVGRFHWCPIRCNKIGFCSN